MELASATGKGRKMTEFTMAKSAALAAMQTANVSSTVSAKPLSRHNERTAYFRSRKNASMICTPHFISPAPDSRQILAVNGRAKSCRQARLVHGNQYA